MPKGEEEKVRNMDCLYACEGVCSKALHVCTGIFTSVCEKYIIYCHVVCELNLMDA